MARRAKRSSKPNPREDRNFGKAKNQNLELERKSSKKQRIDIIPKNIAQERYLKALRNDRQNIVIAMGPAGTGKTLLATQYAIQALREGKYKRIVITRPAVSVDEQHGFLPGTLVQKMEPWILPILDVFKEYYHPKQILAMLEDEVIEISPLAYMRGRTFKDAVIIADEMQNATVSQVRMVTTRIGNNSKMVITGDIQQHDRGFEENGLRDIVRRLRNSDSEGNGLQIIEFGAGDVERHPIIEVINSLYEDSK